MTEAPQRTGEAPRTGGTAVFWGGVCAFAVVDIAPQLGAWLPVERASAVLAYVLLAGFALTLAVVAGVAFTALRARRFPAPGDALRGLVALALAVGHAVLLVIAHGRKGP